MLRKVYLIYSNIHKNNRITCLVCVSCKRRVSPDTEQGHVRKWFNRQFCVLCTEYSIMRLSKTERIFYAVAQNARGLTLGLMRASSQDTCVETHVKRQNNSTTRGGMFSWRGLGNAFQESDLPIKQHAALATHLQRFRQDRTERSVHKNDEEIQ